jgi:hypothetical protein
MKKIMGTMLGLSLLMGTVALFADAPPKDTTKTTKAKKTKKAKTKKTDTTSTEKKS